MTKEEISQLALEYVSNKYYKVYHVEELNGELFSTYHAFIDGINEIKDKLSGFIMSDGDIFEICKSHFANDLSSLKHRDMASYLNGAKMQRNYWENIIKK
jgi:hypothetical protein